MTFKPPKFNSAEIEASYFNFTAIEDLIEEWNTESPSL